MDTTTPAGGPWASPPPPPPGARPPLVRSRSNRKIAGVAAGLAAWLGIDPWAVRLIMLVLMIPLGLGLVLYLLGWVLIPDANGQPAHADGLVRRLQGAPPWVPIVLLVSVVLFFFQSWWLGAPLAVLWAILLIVAGIWLYHNDARRNRPAPAGPAGPPIPYGSVPPAGTPGPYGPVATGGSPGPYGAFPPGGPLSPYGAVPGPGTPATGGPAPTGPAGPALARATAYPVPGVPFFTPAGGLVPTAPAAQTGDENQVANNQAQAAGNEGAAPALASPSGAAQVTQPIAGTLASTPPSGPTWPAVTPPWGSGAAPQQWATPAWGGAGGTGGGITAPTPGWTQPLPVAKKKVKVPKVPSPLGRITFAATLVALGIAALIDRVGIAHVSGRLYPALALIVLGAGLLVGAFWGRAKLMILVGLVVVPIALVSNLAVFVNHNGSGAESFSPVTAGNLKHNYQLGAGQITLDLSQLDWSPSGALTTHVTMGAGNVQIVVPPQVTVRLHAHVGTGVIQFIDGPDRGGIQIT
ncbi:MAG: PspC domain-containing protein, partial [Actinomycetota bacterium]